jgi:SAM-dependent MidA family methyltransferase
MAIPQNSAASIIAKEIEGAPGRVIPFARFMELALYHPEHGYYNRNKDIIGKSGDFFTSVSVGSLFGEMLAFWLERELEQLDGPIQIVEMGAHDGKLARDIINSMRRDVEYIIVEPSRSLESKQRAALDGFPNVSWRRSLEDLVMIRGAIISNELLDAMPVHVCRWDKRNSNWLERGVGIENGVFVWKTFALTKEIRKQARLEEFQDVIAVLPDGYTIEFSPSAEELWRQAASKLWGGGSVMLGIDYGDYRMNVYHGGNPKGTLRAYRNHRLTDDVLGNPGEQDITASVNFSAIRDVGERAGLVSESLMTQGRFLSGLAEGFFREAPDAKVGRQFQTLTHPEHLGGAFKMLAQRKPN